MAWVYRLDDRVRRRCQEAIDEVWAGDRCGLGAAVAPELCPYPSEGEERSIFIQREPDIFFSLV